MRRSFVAVVVAAATSGVVATGLVSPAGAAGHDPVPARQGAGWLNGQLNGKHLMHNAQYDFDDYGLTADTGLELARLGQSKRARAVATALAPKAATQWYSSTFNGVTTTYAGSVAKAAVLARATGLDATSYGGADLVSMLESEVAQGAPIRGRIENQNDSFGDANVLGQALATRALTAAHSPDAARVTSFLLDQQCAAGYFRLGFTKDKASADQGCDAAHGTADTDATSFAVIQLAAMGHQTGPVKTAIAAARSWLRDRQKKSGAWGGGTSTTAANSNSTGLAAWALGNTAASRKAAVWLRKHQVRDAGSCRTRLVRSKGAVAYDTAALRAARKDGITTTVRDQWRRTTAQALVALTLLPRATRHLQVTPARHRVHARHRLAVHVRHATPYSVVCVTIGKHRRAISVGPKGNGTVKVKVPGGRAHRRIGAVDSDGRKDHATLRVLR